MNITTGMVERADAAACKLDGIFLDLFNADDRRDLIVMILRAALVPIDMVALGEEVALSYPTGAQEPADSAYVGCDHGKPLPPAERLSPRKET